jgi:hypothetical protein
VAHLIIKSVINQWTAHVAAKKHRDTCKPDDLPPCCLPLPSKQRLHTEGARVCVNARS